MAKIAKARLWSRRVAAFARSGLSRREWCAREGLNKHTLDYWRVRLRDRTATPKSAAVCSGALPGSGLVPIVVEAKHHGADSACDLQAAVWIELPDGLRVRATARIDAAWLAGLVRGIAGC